MRGLEMRNGLVRRRGLGLRLALLEEHALHELLRVRELIHLGGEGLDGAFDTSIVSEGRLHLLLELFDAPAGFPPTDQTDDEQRSHGGDVAGEPEVFGAHGLLETGLYQPNYTGAGPSGGRNRVSVGME